MLSSKRVLRLPLRLLFTLRFPLAIYLVIVLVFLLLERPLVFPAPRAERTAVDAAEFNGEDVFFSSADGTQLHAQYFPHDNPRGQLLYCHGNGIMVPQLSEYGDWLRSEYGYSVFIYDYRGYGLSEGKPNQKGILEDTEAAHDWLLERGQCGANEVVIVGRSLGGGLAVHVAAQRGARGLVLQNTFASLVETAAQQYPWLPVRSVMKTRMVSIDKIAKYHGPLLQSHGTADRVIRYEDGRALFDAANEPKQFFTNEGGGHNDHNPREYVKMLAGFLDGL